MAFTVNKTGKYLSVDEYAEYAGVTKMTVYKAIKSGRLDYITVGSQKYVPITAVIADSKTKTGRYIAARRKATKSMKIQDRNVNDL